jgi:HAD superfamily hydrolase (TIGR01509 family)
VTAVRGVVFDIGGVLERIDPVTFLDRWQERLGLSDAAMADALAHVDPENVGPVGGIDEYEVRRQYQAALGLDDQQADELVRDLWDWYCGELDDDLMTYARSLHGRVRLAILSNSGPGAREVEQERHDFAALFDPIVYSHEVGLTKPDARIYELTAQRLGLPIGSLVFVDDVAANIDGARAAGMQAHLHTDTSVTIAALDRLLGHRDVR